MAIYILAFFLLGAVFGGCVVSATYEIKRGKK